MTLEITDRKVRNKILLVPGGGIGGVAKKALADVDLLVEGEMAA